MGAHSAVGHASRRPATTAVGLAAALVTTAATGLLTGGTALATDGHGGSGHSHGHGSRWADGSDGSDHSDYGPGAAWCDVFGDDDLGEPSACNDDSSGASGSAGTTSTVAAPAPVPQRPTSSVPDHPTIQPIVAPPSGRRVVPIAAAG